MTDYEQIFDYLRKNKSVLMLEKKASMKCADAIETHYVKTIDDKTMAVKAIEDTEIPENGKFNIKVAINTTNIIDSHMDMHVNGIWKKSLKEIKNLYLFQEHKYSFEYVISDSVKASTVLMSWKDLGYNYDGLTEVLVFDAEVNPDDNELMAKKYKQNKVKNHSVGMRYVKIELAMNSDSRWDEEEKKVWDKYYPIVVNKEVADERGYFWVVTEAKIVEGSAVPIGSNQATPTLNISEAKSTQEEPAEQSQVKNEPQITESELKRVLEEKLNIKF